MTVGVSRPSPAPYFAVAHEPQPFDTNAASPRSRLLSPHTAQRPACQAGPAPGPGEADGVGGNAPTVPDAGQGTVLLGHPARSCSTEKQAQLAAIMERAVEVACTVADPEAAAYEVEQVQ